MIGSIVLTAALVFSIIAMVMYYLTFRGYKNTLSYARLSYHAMAIFVIAGSVLLWHALLTHQYQYNYVYSYSNGSLSTGLLFSSFWGGQEGSFLLWLLLTAIIGIILQSYSSKRGDLEPRVMTIFALATSFLLVMVSPWFKNPFEYIWAVPVFINIKDINPQYLNMPFLQNFLFTDGQAGQSFVQMSKDLYATLSTSGIAVNNFIIDGKGLNPQLLNWWMQIHPPVLFMGFAMATVPFSFAMAAMMKNEYKDWIRQAFPWMLAGAGILGLGIMMGGYWAYEMLGWGGYWAWDPVENSSLIPWIVGVASIHTLLVQRKSQQNGDSVGRYAKTNLILSILTYVFVLYSTFLTRSGILGDSSVHSFVDPGMLIYLFLLIFIGSFILLGFGSIAYRWKDLNVQIPQDENILSRELSLFTAAVVLGASALIILVGTSAPIFGRSVDTFFYNEMHLPIAIIIGFLNGLSLLIKWKKTSTQELIKSSIFSASASIILTIVIVIFSGITDIMMIVLTLSSVFALIVNGEIAVKIVKKNMKMLGAYIAHIGIAVFLLGVIGSAAYSEEVDLDLIKNKPAQAFGYEMTFTGYQPIENNTKYAFNIELKKGEKSYSVTPIMYIAEFNNSLVREPAILSTFARDLYFAPMGYEEGKQNQEGSVVSLQRGASTQYGNIKITFNDFDFPAEVRDAMMSGAAFEIGVKLTVEADGKTQQARVAMQSQGGEKLLTATELPDMNLKIQLNNLDASGKVDLMLSNLNGVTDDNQTAQINEEVLTVSASIKPYISLVWIGVVFMVLGFFVSAVRRLKESLI
ncbi:MAG: cytochrome c biogenesis protein CcsA [Ignavibacteriaceae bacterium]|nr:cytochrome c biogenesis protein CcsA [Ignavibacteriaceae bacterium]